MRNEAEIQRRKEVSSGSRSDGGGTLHLVPPTKNLLGTWQNVDSSLVRAVTSSEDSRWGRVGVGVVDDDTPSAR